MNDDTNPTRVGRGVIGQQWIECTVKATGVSPMNPKVKWAELDCGHTVWRKRKPRVGATVICTECAKEKE